MFSANENLVLRQHKRRIVQDIESTMPEEALDLGTTVMVMQVSCKAVGCVPLETAIIIIFPASEKELVPGLPESRHGGSYKTKVLKPMAEVTKEDILEALPPAFEGGKRTMEKLCLYARDVMLAQITQLVGDDGPIVDRRAMAEYLQLCLQEYIRNDCQAPEPGEPFPVSSPPPTEQMVEHSEQPLDTNMVSQGDDASNQPSSDPSFPATGNLVIRRVVTEPTTPTPNNHETTTTSTASNTAFGGGGGGGGFGVASTRGARKHGQAIQNALYPSSATSIANLFEREHAPGIRQPGCPCCDPGDPSNITDRMMML